MFCTIHLEGLAIAAGGRGTKQGVGWGRKDFGPLSHLRVTVLITRKKLE